MLELQPIILAAGEGSKMYPLTDEKMPKCLLPIGNMPMIWYVVNYLEMSGFQDFIVVTRASFLGKVQQTLHSCCKPHSRFEMIKLADENVGTVDALTVLKSKIKSDILVVSCDMVTMTPIHRLIDIHRTYDASVTVMLSKQVDLQTERTSAKDKNALSTGSRDFVAIDDEENRLLFFVNEGDLEKENIKIKKSVLKRYPHMKILTYLVDSHLYIMKKTIIDYITSNSQFENIKSDVIPHIVRKQFSKSAKDQICNVTMSKEDDTVSASMQHYSGYQGDCLKDLLKCHVFVSDDFCLRVNTIPSYIYINRHFSKLKSEIAPNLDVQNVHTSVSREKCQIGNDCLVGESTSCSENVIIKRSVIGKHCTIGANTRVTNCMFMDHVTVKEGCNLQGCIIGHNTYINAHCTLENCQVSLNETIAANVVLKDTVIVQEEMEFDE